MANGDLKEEMGQVLYAACTQTHLSYRKTWPYSGGGGGSRTPVRKALRRGAYMLISVPVAIRLREPLFRQPRSERARNAAG